MGLIPYAIKKFIYQIINKEKGAPEGIAPLDANALVPLGNIPDWLQGKNADEVDGLHATDLILRFYSEGRDTTILPREVRINEDYKCIQRWFEDPKLEISGWRTVLGNGVGDVDTVDGMHAFEFLDKATYDSDDDGIINLDSIPTIPRAKLEYPTVDVSLAYLSAINKINFDITSGPARPLATFVVTSDSFTDKAVKCQCVDGTGLFGRWIDVNNWYEAVLESGRATADFRIHVISAGTTTTLASESVDIRADSRHLLKFSISGSTLTGYRNDMTTPKISATDTTHASGMFGVLQGTSGGTNNTDALLGILLAPSSPLPPAKAIIECDVTGSGTVDDPIRPNMWQELVEINKLTNIPEFFKQEAKKYEILKNKGFTDEEIKALLGYIPRHQFDLSTVSWGYFDYKPEHNTMLITITADNYFKEGAILKQVEHAKAKNLKVLKTPKDYREAVEQYKQLIKDFPEWLAGKDNYAYQTIGHEALGYLQVADTFHGRIIEMGDKKAFKNVPDWEMKNTLNTCINRLKKVGVLKEEADKHIKKLEKVIKVGW